MNTFLRLKPVNLIFEGIDKDISNYRYEYLKEGVIIFNLSEQSFQTYHFNKAMFENAQIFQFDKEGKISMKPQSERTLSITVSQTNEIYHTKLEVPPQKVTHMIRNILGSEVASVVSHEQIDEIFGDWIGEDEVVSCSLSGALGDRELYYVIGTTTGHLVIIPLFLYNGERIIKFYCAKIDRFSLSHIEIAVGQILVCSEEGNFCIIDFIGEEGGHRTINRMMLENEYTLELHEINPQAETMMNLKGAVKQLMPVVIEGEEDENTLMFKQFFSKTIGVVLENNQLVLVSLDTKYIIFEHTNNEQPIMGLFFDSYNEYLYFLYRDGQVDIFNANLGNVIAMMKTRNQVLEHVDPANRDKGNQDILFQLQFFIKSCFSFERTVSIRTHPLNLHDLLEQYRNCYLDFKSFSKFCNSVLLNLTPAGQVIEYCVQHFTNPLLSTHINLISFSEAQNLKNPHNLFTEKDTKRAQAAASSINNLDNWGNITDLKQLSEQIEKVNQENEAQNKLSTGDLYSANSVLDHKNIPLLIQNCVERDKFSLARERLGEEPLKMLDHFNGDELVGDEDLDQLIAAISTLNYSSRQIIIDSKSRSASTMVNLKIGTSSLNALLVSPPKYSPETKDYRLLLTSLVFPFSIDSPSDSTVKKALGRHTPVIDMMPGVQGVGDSISFSLNQSIIQISKEIRGVQKAEYKECSVQNLNKELYKISRFHSSCYMLGVVCEMIYLLKKGYLKVSLMKSCFRKVFFELLPSMPDNKALSFKLLSWLILNDKLLLSAGSHFIINNIYSKKLNQQVFQVDKSTIDFCSQFFLTAQSNSHLQDMVSGDSPLSQISKLELFSTSILMVELHKNKREDILHDNMVTFSQSLIVKLISKSIEIKVCSCYPFLVMPLIKICLESLNHISVRSQAPVFGLLIRNLANISLYYGLTYDKKEDHIFDKSLLKDEDLKRDKSLLNLVGKLRHQSMDVRRGIRIHVMKLIRQLGELDMAFLLDVLKDTVLNRELTKLVAVNTFDFLNYIMRNCNSYLSDHLIQWTEILMA